MKFKSLPFLMNTVFLLFSFVLQAQFDDIYYNPDEEVWVESQGDSPTEESDYDDAFYTEDLQEGNWEDYDYYYTSRIRRFARPFVGFDYYDHYYTDPYWYDGYRGGTNIYISYGYYRPYWSRYGYGGAFYCDPWYSPWSGYDCSYSGGWGRYQRGYRRGYRDGFYDGYYWGRYDYGGYGYGGYGYGWGGYHHGYWPNYGHSGYRDDGRTTGTGRDSYHGPRKTGGVKTSHRGPVTASGVRTKTVGKGQTNTHGTRVGRRVKADRYDHPPNRGNSPQIKRTKRTGYKAEPSKSNTSWKKGRYSAKRTAKSEEYIGRGHSAPKYRGHQSNRRSDTSPDKVRKRSPLTKHKGYRSIERPSNRSKVAPSMHRSQKRHSHSTGHPTRTREMKPRASSRRNHYLASSTSRSNQVSRSMRSSPRQAPHSSARSFSRASSSKPSRSSRRGMKRR